jgi:hypothetical protein
LKYRQPLPLMVGELRSFPSFSGGGFFFSASILELVTSVGTKTSNQFPIRSRREAPGLASAKWQIAIRCDANVFIDLESSVRIWTGAVSCPLLFGGKLGGEQEAR